MSPQFVLVLQLMFCQYPEYEDKIVLVVKGGLDDSFGFPKGWVRLVPVTYSQRITADHMHSCSDLAEFARGELKRCQELLGDKKIDVYSIARVYKNVEEIFRDVKVLHEEGLFVEVGASEISAGSLEKGHKVSHLSP